MMASQYGTIGIEVFDNTGGVDTCVTCSSFGGAYIYCPVFNHIIKEGDIKFDETGERNRCELFQKHNNGIRP